MATKKPVRKNEDKPDSKKNTTDLPDIICKIIDQQWSDIHHSRNQDWLYWTILAVLIAGIIAVSGSEGLSKNISARNFYIGILLAMGGIISFWAAKISKSHWLLHIRKLGYITWLVDSLNQLLKNRDDNVSFNIYPKDVRDFKMLAREDSYVVNGLINAMYWTIFFFCVFSLLVLTVYSCLMTNSVIVNFFSAAIKYIPALIFIFGIILLNVIHSKNKRRYKTISDSYVEMLKKVNILSVENEFDDFN